MLVNAHELPEDELEETFPEDEEDALLDSEEEKETPEDEVTEEELQELTEEEEDWEEEDRDEEEPEDDIPTEGEEETPEKDTPETPEPDAPPAEKEPDEKDREIASLRARLARLESRAKDALKNLGRSHENIMDGFAEIGAEATGKSIDEYKRLRDETERGEEALRAMRTAKFEEKKKADLAAVHAAFPETKGVTRIEEISGFKRFAELRDKGLTPKEAYIAANPDAVRESVASAAKRQSLGDTKKHLSPAVSKETRDTSLKMTKQDDALCRELFPHMSAKERAAIFRQAK